MHLGKRNGCLGGKVGGGGGDDLVPAVLSFGGGGIRLEYSLWEL